MTEATTEATTEETPLVICPNCRTKLVALESATRCLCPSCGAFFQRGRVATTPGRLSRRALASFVLGVLSIVGLMLTGIPAVILGILALRDIHARPGQLRGRGWAIAGIAGGCLLGLTCGPYMTMVSVHTVAMVRSIVDTNDPEQIAELADEMEVPNPDGLSALRGVNQPMEGLRFLGYGDNAGTIAVVAEQPSHFGAASMDGQLRKALDRFELGLTDTTEREITIKLLGREVPLLVTQGRNPKRDKPVERLRLNLDRKQSRLALLWMTVNPKDGEEEQRRERFLEFARRLEAEAPSSDD